MARVNSRPIRGSTVLILLLAAVASAPAVQADGEASGIVVTPPIAQPGDEILVQGVALWTELPITAALVGETGASRMLGMGATNPDGSLSLTVRIPEDAPAGRYTVLVTNVNGEQAEAPVVIQPELPILPVVVLGGATLAVGFVAIAAWRRRSLIKATLEGDE